MTRTTPDAPDGRDDAGLQPHPQVDDSQDIVHVAVDNSIDHLVAAGSGSGSDFGNNPPQLLHEVYHVVVVDRDVDLAYRPRLGTRRVVVVVDNLVADYCTADFVEGIAGDLVVAGDLVDFPHRVFAGGSGRFDSLTPCWASGAGIKSRKYLSKLIITVGSGSPTGLM